MTSAVPPYLTVAEALSPDERNGFQEWHGHAERVGGEASLLLRSLSREQQLEEASLAALLRRITEEYGRVVASLTDEHPVIVFASACRLPDLHFRGPQARLSDAMTLHRIINIRDLRELIFKALGEPGDGPGRVERAWDTFRGLSVADQLSVLELVGVEPSSYVYWAYFSESDSPDARASDPLSGLSAAECCNRLGLPEIWSKYGRGEQLWKIHYLPSDSVHRLVPTLVDGCVGGWNRYFVPCVDHRSVSKWGRTGPLDGTPAGLPEVIHRGWERRTEPRAFFMMPEELGVR
jgi:lambda repressor-like predicted transcriptional regulator